jgi:amino acid transporter
VECDKCGAQAIVGTLPGVFAKTSRRYGTPYVAIIANSVFIASVVFMPFEALAEVTVAKYNTSKIKSLTKIKD